MIPRIIHYCWFGGKEKPEVVKRCIASWKKYCPDWEIIEWNETNFDVSLVPYMKEAYEMQKWAFVSDVARLLIIYHRGGVYLDTDVELLDTLDSWMDKAAFFVFESNRNLASGLGFGAIEQHKAIKAMLDFYNGKHFVINGKAKMIPCPANNTESFAGTYKEFKRNGITQLIDDVLVLSTNDYSQKAIHHGTATWVDYYEKKTTMYKETKIKTILRSYEIFDFIEKHFGRTVVSIYTFVVYDLLEMGIGYYLKRIISKLKENSNCI